MKAVIMAGGEGTRLRPLTSNIPKPMLPLVNVPMMEHIVDLLKGHGITEIVVTVAFMPYAIRNYFGDGSEFGVSISYASEDTPLGTAGSVRNAMDELDDTFLVISGDVLTDVNLDAVISAHREHGALATIGLVRVENPLEYGIVIANEDGSIERFLEKPTWGQVFSDTINSGIYVLEPEVFEWIAPDEPVDFSSDVFPKLLEDGKGVFGAILEGYWEDVGTLDAYLRAHKDILDDRVDVNIGGFEVSDGVFVGEGAEIHPDAVLSGPAVIGDNCFIDADVSLGEYTVLGTGVRVRRDCHFERVVVHDNSYIGEGTRLRGTVIGRASDIRGGVRCEEGAVLGDEVFIGENALITTDVKIYPFKTVEAGAVVNTSIIWESRGARSLFGKGGVTGLANVDMTPELAAKVALAFATSLKNGATVVISRDSSRAARMLKRAMIAGLNAGGVNVMDLETASVPLTRFHCRSAVATAGITLRLSSNDPDSVTIRFFDGDGSDIIEEQQRKIERLFGREDFRRVRPADIGDIDLVPRALEQYAIALEQTVDVRSIASRRFKVVIDYSYGSTSFAMPNVLAKLGAEVLAVNPYASTKGLLGFDREEHARNVSALVKASGADLGAVLDPPGEQLVLVDDEGAVLGFDEMLLVFLDLVCDRLYGDKVVLPVNASAAAARIVSDRGYEVVWSKTSSAALMAAADEPGVGFAANLEGGVILPGFLPSFDAAAGLLKMMDLLSARGAKLSEVRASAPAVHRLRESVVTPWEQKGSVMRTMVEQTQGRDVELIDGIKIFHDGGWVLVLPDPEEPLTHIWAEGDSPESARTLAQEYVRRLRQMVR
ncbi:MAG: NTP transferase domain-containing protein [Microthrixaceae bacterium]|nr:NTP transferase domain-containing protein [Microthrixaceae bacterium]